MQRKWIKTFLVRRNTKGFKVQILAGKCQMGPKYQIHSALINSNLDLSPTKLSQGWARCSNVSHLRSADFAYVFVLLSCVCVWERRSREEGDRGAAPQASHERCTDCSFLTNHQSLKHLTCQFQFCLILIFLTDRQVFNLNSLRNIKQYPWTSINFF